MTDSTEFVRSLYGYFAAGDIPGLLGTFAPGIVWNEAESNPLGAGNPYVGGEAIVAGVFGPLMEEWDDFRVEVGEIVGGPEVVTMLGRYRATHKGSGKPLDVQATHTWWIADGKVTRFQQMVDTLAYDAASR